MKSRRLTGRDWHVRLALVGCNTSGLKWEVMGEEKAMSPYWEGVNARREGLPEYSNPYSTGTGKHRAWYSGWIEGINVKPDQKINLS